MDLSKRFYRSDFPLSLSRRPITPPDIPMPSSINTTSPSSNFEALFDAALTKYTKRTGKGLADHPLTAMLDRCSSPDDVLAIFEEQAKAFDEFRNGDPKLIKWLRPIADGLHTLCTNATVDTAACVVSPHRYFVVFLSGVLKRSFVRCIRRQRQFCLESGSFSLYVSPSLLKPTPDVRVGQTAKYVRSSYESLVDIFECVENFLRRLKIYTEVPPTPAMTDILFKIMVEVLSVLALATKQINQGRFSKPMLPDNSHTAHVSCCREICEEIAGRTRH